MATIQVPPGFEVQLVAAEPDVLDPVAIDWGPDGRLWVVEMADYPNGMDDRGAPGGRIRVLTDTDNDGRYDKSTLFAEGLNFPNGLLVWREGVLVTAAPEILFLADKDGDGRADERKVLYSGFQEGNQQLRMNGLRWGLDNWVYCASGGHYGKYGEGTKIKSFNGTAVEVGSRDFRIRSDTGEIEPQSGPSQFGRNRDAWGNWFGVQNSFPLWHYVLEDQYTRRNPHFAPPDGRQLFLNPPNPKVYPAGELEKRYHSFEQSGRFTSACSATVYGDEILFPACYTKDGFAEEHAFTCEPFHNLVQHIVLKPAGVSFTAERANDGIPTDFFASSDRWCRPVMVRTGPDGALWVVDMYRYMIEHPHWLPDAGKEELRPFYRSGEDKGRIYRVVKKGTPLRTIVKLDQLNSEELVAAIDSPNSQQRDRVQQLLIGLDVKVTVSRLRDLVTESKHPLTRMQALCTLDGSDGIRTDTLLEALQDSHPGVRRQAVRLAETRGETNPELIAAACKLSADPDAKVRLQLAATLGQWKTPEAAQALGELAARDAEDPFISATVFSSLRKDNLAEVLSVVLSKQDAQGSQGPLVGQLLAMSAALGSDEALVKALTSLLSGSEQATAALRFGTAAGMFDALAKRETPPSKLPAFKSSEGQAVLKQLEQLIFSAREMASDEDAAEANRAAAIALLCRDADKRAADIAALGKLLTPQTPVAVQKAVVEHLASREDAETPALFLAAWRGLSPTVRGEVLSTLLSRDAWIGPLLASLEAGDLLPGEIDAQARQRLVVQRDAKLRARAEKLFASATSADRKKTLEQFSASLKLEGEAARGAKVFEKRCSTCHKLGTVGHEVGPNLASLTNKTPSALLESILDPSRAVESKYQAYLAQTSDGRTLTGLLVEETGSSLTLLAAEGKRQVLLRRDVEELRSSGKSLMPDGLEKDITPQEVADLLKFLSGS